MPAFLELQRNITALYKALGCEVTRCANSPQPLGEHPTLGIDFVPAEARDILIRLAEEAGVTVIKGDGAPALPNEGGKGAFFRFPTNDLTVEQLKAFSAAVAGEVMTYLDGAKFLAVPMAEEYDRLAAGKSGTEQLALLSGIITGSNELPDTLKRPLIEKITQLKRAIDKSPS